jgi:AcrR family transcriptional regulator
VALLDDRPLRADAQRNRAAIVKAARAVFARYGREAQMDDVARRAKVGIGTLYRHFPTKEALLAALAEDRFRQLAEFALDALTVEDAWEAIRDFTHRAGALQASDRALSQILAQRPDLMCEAACERGDLRAALQELVDRAQAAGTLRADARWSDIPMILTALSHVGGPPGASWDRMLALALDGLRPSGGRPLPE